MEKKCTKCGEVKSLDEFTNVKKGKHGKNARCKLCSNYYNKIYRERNKEYLKNRREENKEKTKERLKKNKGKTNEYIKLRLKKDKLFKLNINTRNNIGNSLRRKGYNKKN